MRQQKAEKKLVTTIQLPELIIKEEPIYEDEEYLDQIHEPEAKNEVQATENLNKVSFPHEELLLKIVPQTDTQSPLKTTKMIYRKFYLPQPSNLKISRVQSILTKPMTVNNQQY